MALLTPFPFEEARVVVADYGIELAHVTPLEAGSVNSNFLLEAVHGTRYFARIYEEQGEVGAEFELQLNETLAHRGVPVARPLRRKSGDLVAFTLGKPFAVYEHIRGEVLCQKRVTPDVTRAVGEALARVHTVDLGGLHVPAGRFDFDGLRARLDRVEASGRASLAAPTRRLRALFDELERSRATNLPHGLIHGDLFRDNVLVDGPRIVALLDFESACQGNYAYDLAVTLLAWCMGDVLDPTLFQPMIEGYESVRPLTAPERAAFVTEASIACVRFATTRLTDFTLRVPEGEKPARDYERFLERLEAVRAGVLGIA